VPRQVAACHTQSPWVSAYPWDNGFGIRFSNPATLPDAGRSLAFSRTNAALLVADNSNNRIKAYAWSASGFGTRYTNLPVQSAGGFDSMCFYTDRLAVTHATSPYASMFPWSDSTGFGTRYAAPTGYTGDNSCSFSPSGELFLAGDLYPFISAFSFNASGWGTRYSDPAILPTGSVLSINANVSGNSICYSGTTASNNKFVAFNWSSATGWGTRYFTAPTANNGRDAVFDESGTGAVFGGATTPFISGFPWSNSTGFGTQYSNPTIALAATGLSVSVRDNTAFAAHSNGVFLSAYPWSTSGFGVRYAGPGSPIGNAAKVAVTYYTPVAYSITADVASFALTGADATLTKTTVAGYTLAASVGSFSLAGQPIGLPLGRKITAAQGAFSLTGIDLVLRSTRIMAASYGTYGLTGIAIRLVTTRIVTASTRSFTLTGINNRFFISRKIIATSNAFLLTGNQANLITSASRSLLAAAGQFVLSGISSTLSKGSRALGSVGVFTVTRRPAGLVSTRIIVSGPRSFLLSGESSTLAFGRKLPISSRQFAVSGIASDLFRTRSLYATPRQFLLTGSTTYLRIIHPPIICQAGTFTLPYLATSLRYSNPKVSQLPPRLEFQSSGKNVNLKPSRAIIGTMSFAMEQTACALRWHRV
jgi:hypothetical protein